jgi:hypothetical protein
LPNNTSLLEYTSTNLHTKSKACLELLETKRYKRAERICTENMNACSQEFIQAQFNTLKKMHAGTRLMHHLRNEMHVK